MGTGRFGSGGSGALGRTGSGSGSARKGAAGIAGPGGEFLAWKSTRRATPDPALSPELVRATLAQRNVASYTFDLCTSDAVQGCYDDLVRIAALLTDSPDWDAVARAFNVPGTPGCLAELLNKIESRNATSVIEAHREVAGSAVFDVLTAAVGDDEDVFLDGDAETVLRKLDMQVLARLSGHYFGSVLHRSLLRDLPTLDEQEAPVIRDAIQARADYIIDNFKNRFMIDGVIHHRDLLRIISENQSWFESQLRQVIE
jgi:hypothetical protein